MAVRDGPGGGGGWGWWVGPLLSMIRMSNELSGPGCGGLLGVVGGGGLNAIG